MGRSLLLAMLLPCAPLLCAACAPPASRGGFDSGNPAARLYAIEDAVRRGDQAAVPQIVTSLDSDDPAERMLAIEALQRLTGETLGYRYDAARPDREAAVHRWTVRISGEDHPHD